jgi:hypothetical protein
MEIGPQYSKSRDDKQRLRVVLSPKQPQELTHPSNHRHLPKLHINWTSVPHITNKPTLLLSLCTLACIENTRSVAVFDASYRIASQLDVPHTAHICIRNFPKSEVNTT